MLNKSVLITGASSGIGEAFAKAVHAKGAKVILVARREDRLRSITEELNRERSDSAVYWACDLCSQESKGGLIGLDDLCEKVKETHIDVLINNAGFGSFGRLESLSLQNEQQMILLNAVATMTLFHAVIPQMKSRRSGALISLSSVAGIQPIPYMSTYAATKAFNLSQGRSLRQELKKFNIKVLTVCPGPVHTEFGHVAKVPGGFNGPHDPVDMIVKRSLRALEKNRSLVFPGNIAWVAGTICRLLPKLISSWFVEKSLSKKLPN